MLPLSALCWRSRPEIIKDNEGSGKFFEDEMTGYFSANRLVSILSSKLLQVLFLYSVIFDTFFSMFVHAILLL